MKHTPAFPSLVPILFSTFAVTCGGSTSTDLGSSGNCTPGASAACTGPAGCSGFQICRSDRSGFDACSCSGAADGGGDAALLGDDAGGIAETGALDGATGHDSGSEGGTWTPKSLNGLVLWLDDTVGVVADPQMSGSVKRWLDQSGGGNTATGVNAEATIDPAVINGHDAVICPYQGWLEIADSPSFHWGTGDFAITMVVKVQIGATMWWKYDGTSGVISSVDTGDVFRLLVNPNPAVRMLNPDPSKFHVLTVRGAALRIDADGQMVSGTTNTTDISEVGVAPRLCQGNGAGNAQTIEIAEVVAVKGTLPDTDLVKLESYLKMKFALP